MNYQLITIYAIYYIVGFLPAYLMLYSNEIFNKNVITQKESIFLILFSFGSWISLFTCAILRCAMEYDRLNDPLRK